jgi:putative acetyltransferase
MHAGPKSGETGSITLELVSPSHADAHRLICELDSEIAALYPDSPINGINAIEFDRNGGYFVVARQAGHAVGCGGFRHVDESCAEIKRMFVRASARRHGIAREILRHLEAEICRQGYSTIVLETGCDNAAALALYQAEGYLPIPAFLGYVGIPISRCFAKWA